jgi:hypothetical protein
MIHILGLLAYRAPAAGLRRLFALLSDQLGREPGVGTLLLLIPAMLLFGVLLGAIYGAWLGNGGFVRGPLRGAAYAMAPLLVSLFVLLPLVGAGPAGADLDSGPVPAIGETIRHLVYGLILGTVYPALVRAPLVRPITKTRRAQPGGAPIAAPTS